VSDFVFGEGPPHVRLWGAPILLKKVP